MLRAATEHAARVAPAMLERMVFMTGGAFTPQAKAFLARVANERVEKPFDSKKLRALADRFRSRRALEVAS